MIARGEDEARISALCLDIAAETAEASGLGALQFNWVDPEFAPRFGARGRLLEWSHQSYLWSDSIEGEAGFESSAGGYGNFESYLRAFSKNMRRNVRREREGLAAAGVTSRIIRSAEAASHPKLLSRMADFYESTNDKFGPYAARFLERDFFLRLPEFMDEGWLLSAGYERDAPIDDPIGLAFLFEGKNRLFGRYWGAARFVPGLHYELCYYRPIEYALERGIHAFDPGMGSEHKARRGFRSVLAPSFHLAFDKRIQNLLAGYIPLASREASRAARALDEELPFKRG